MAESQIFMSFQSGKQGPIKGEHDLGDAASKGPGDNWIALESCEIELAPERAHTSQRTAKSRLEPKPVRLTKRSDTSTVLLLADAFYNTSGSKVDFTFLQPDSGGKAIEYLRLECEGVGIVSFAMDGGGEDRWTETWEFYFARMTVTAWQFDGSGRRSPASYVIDADRS